MELSLSVLVLLEALTDVVAVLDLKSCDAYLIRRVGSTPTASSNLERKDLPEIKWNLFSKLKIKLNYRK